MIAYHTRKRDLEERAFILDMLDYALRSYERTHDEHFILFWQEELSNVEQRLKGDYTQKEIAYNKITEDLKTVHL